MTKTSKGLLALVLIAIWVLGTLGGTGYLLYYGQTVIGIATMLMGVIAAPIVYKFFKDSLE